MDPYDDTLLSHEELEMIQQLCVRIDVLFVDAQDYSIYNILKESHINKNDLIDFSNSMQDLISYAFENGKDVWAIGD